MVSAGKPETQTHRFLEDKKPNAGGYFKFYFL